MSNKIILLGGAMLFLITATVLPQTVVIDTPYSDEITIQLPDNLEDAHELIVALSELYWGERYDREWTDESLTRALEQIGSLQHIIADLQKQLVRTQELLDEAIAPDILRAAAGVTYSYPITIDNTEGHTVGVEAGVEIVERVRAMIGLRLPLALTFSVSTTF